MSTVPEYTTSMDVHKLLELLNTVDDYETYHKIFSVLAMLLVSNCGSSSYEVIFTCKAVYEKIRIILNKGLPLKAAGTLNFISALLFIDDEEKLVTRKQSMIVYAQNMFRTSGCLLEMCTMFTSCMMHQETWIALCQCIAECCRNSKQNQTYCSHLIPLGVKKCIQGCMDVTVTLKSLISNHERNVQLFLESNGIKIFKREFLQYENCLQLLDTLIQNLTPENLVSFPTSLIQNLKYFINLHGTTTRVGQWAIVIVHRLDSKRVKVVQSKKGTDTQNIIKPLKHVEKNESTVYDTGFLRPNSDETTKLLQNVIREINQYNYSEHQRKNKDIRGNKTKLQVFDQGSFKPLKSQRGLVLNSQAKCTRRTITEPFNETTFSFLLKQNSQEFIMPKDFNLQKTVNMQRIQSLDENGSYNNENCGTPVRKTRVKGLLDDDEPSLLDFKPVFVSTPKHLKRVSEIGNLTKCSRLSRFSHRKFKNTDRRKISRRDDHNDLETSKSNIKHQSLGSRLFDVINNSCTTFVKTVTNIFKPAKREENTRANFTPSSGENSKNSCSYSFTEYMRKRDAVLSNKWTTKESSSKENINSCKTCNDTSTLKRKVIRDDYLKNTIKKLKLGINLYGCDFKKIAKTMWPNEAYMTPEVLYNLYRKLILK